MNFFWLYFVLIGNFWHELEVKSLSWGWDASLILAIKEATPEFASSLKRRFTNAGVSAEMRSANTQPISFEDQSIKIDDNQLTLKNLTIENQPIARMNDIMPNLLEKNIKIAADWYNVIIKGFYEITNTSQLDILPIQNTGSIEMKIENITADGLVGFQVCSGTLKTNNYDLNFTSENISIEVDYLQIESKVKSLQIKENIDSSIAKYIKRDLYWKLQQSLRHRLDQVLDDFTVPDIFSENPEISQKYIVHSEAVDDLINKLIDKFIKNIKHYIVQRNYHNISVPDLKTDFSHKFGPITFWGSFEAKKGFLRDLSQIKRTGNFSIASAPNTDDVQLFGSIGFTDLILDYRYYYARVWNIGPWGDIKAYVGNNSISFKITAELRNLYDFDVLLKDIDLRIEHLENIKVFPTGLGISLNWLLMYISTWVTGYCKQDIVHIIESELRKLLRSYLPIKFP